ncbi:MAG TPA: DUF2905 domain-containing protein [Chryseosolibacter sp.]|jgi:Protein of unknown function (DUF2905).
MGKFLIITGIILVITGIIIHFAPRLPFPGKLPGDIVIDRGNFKMYLPITTSILISLVLSLILYFINKSK